MDALLSTVCMGSAVVVGTISYTVARLRNKNKDERQKRKQVKHRLDAMDRKRVQAVDELKKTLNNKLADLRHNVKGQLAMIAAQRIAEDVFYEWLNHNYGLFNCSMGDCHIRITGTHNGFFQYDLPDQLTHYKG